MYDNETQIPELLTEVVNDIRKTLTSILNLQNEHDAETLQKTVSRLIRKIETVRANRTIDYIQNRVIPTHLTDYALLDAGIPKQLIEQLEDRNIRWKLQDLIKAGNERKNDQEKNIN